MYVLVDIDVEVFAIAHLLVSSSEVLSYGSMISFVSNGRLRLIV